MARAIAASTMDQLSASDGYTGPSALATSAGSAFDGSSPNAANGLAAAAAVVVVAFPVAVVAGPAAVVAVAALVAAVDAAVVVACAGAAVVDVDFELLPHAAATIANKAMTPMVRFKCTVSSP